MSYTNSTNRGCENQLTIITIRIEKNKCVNKVWYWKCVASKCSGKAKPKHERDNGGKDVVSEFMMTNAHTHCVIPNNKSPLSTKQKHEPSAKVTQEKLSRVVPKTRQNIKLRETGALTNGHNNVSRNYFYLVPIR